MNELYNFLQEGMDRYNRTNHSKKVAMMNNNICDGLHCENCPFSLLLKSSCPIESGLKKESSTNDIPPELEAKFQATSEFTTGTKYTIHRHLGANNSSY